jgi:hypothetical protein
LSGGETAFEINTLIIHPVRQRLDTMRFYINILTTYFPDLDPPYDVYYEQILEQVQLAEELG